MNFRWNGWILFLNLVFNLSSRILFHLRRLKERSQSLVLRMIIDFTHIGNCRWYVFHFWSLQSLEQKYMWNSLSEKCPWPIWKYPETRKHVHLLSETFENFYLSLSNRKWDKISFLFWENTLVSHDYITFLFLVDFSCVFHYRTSLFSSLPIDLTGYRIKQIKYFVQGRASIIVTNLQYLHVYYAYVFIWLMS